MFCVYKLQHHGPVLKNQACTVPRRRGGTKVLRIESPIHLYPVIPALVYLLEIVKSIYKHENIVKTSLKNLIILVSRDCDPKSETIIGS